MNNDSNNSFLDKKTILAIFLVGLGWLGWQSYMTKKYPHSPAAMQTKNEQNKEIQDTKNSLKTPTEANQLVEPDISENNVNKRSILSEKLMHFEDESWSFDLSSYGMGLKNIKLKKYKDREGNLVNIGSKSLNPIFATSLIGNNEPIYFDIVANNPNEFQGRSEVNGTQITKIIRIRSSSYSLESEVFVTHLSSGFLGLSTLIGEGIQKTSSSSHFLMPVFDQHEFYTYSQNGKERFKISNDALTKVSGKINNVQVAALGNQYFAQAVVDQSSVFPEFKMLGDQEKSSVMGEIQYHLLNKSDSFKIQYVAFAGPKSYDNLEQINPHLANLIDFGFFSGIAKYILIMMKWFYQLLGNWGFAIILLTIIVRIIVLPFAILSFKSMKNMQLIQPQIKVLREKYKDDQVRLNQEMMSLMKTHKVNPLGGCLPMLLQFPVFIALYQVLGHSIELYQAPFAFWIRDLSLKDPFYVLPILMGITMFIQQKITPNTMDPAQAKILMFMPIIFTFFMVSLPSGLTLYIFISSLFGVTQQLYLVRDKQKIVVSEGVVKQQSQREI